MKSQSLTSVSAGSMSTKHAELGLLDGLLALAPTTLPAQLLALEDRAELREARLLSKVDPIHWPHRPSGNLADCASALEGGEDARTLAAELPSDLADGNLASRSSPTTRP